MLIHILTLLTVVVIIGGNKILPPLKTLIEALFKGLGKLIAGFVTIAIQVISEALRLLGLLITKVFETIVTLINKVTK